MKNGIMQKENENCLAGMACPSCQSLGDFELETEGVNPELLSEMGDFIREPTSNDVTCYMARWSDDGSTDTAGDIEFVNDGKASCCECGHEGKVNEFYLKSQ